MTDRVIKAINNGELTIEKLTPDYLRDAYRRDIYQDGRLALERGRVIIPETEMLDQYLHTYGKMVNQQWKEPFEFRMLDGDTTIIDYGCGQGLSFLNFICRWIPDDADKTWQDYLKTIVLIEPSQIALNRAAAIAKLKFPNANIDLINRRLEDLSTEDVSYEPNEIFIHIFSQVLDIPFDKDFDLPNFLESITSTEGTHYILAISHDIEKLNSADQILKLYKYIGDQYVFECLSLDSIKLLLDESSVSKIKKTTNIALNTYETEDGYRTISLFACIKTS